jgi:hypothetical protein
MLIYLDKKIGRSSLPILDHYDYRLAIVTTEPAVAAPNVHPTDAFVSNSNVLVSVH